MTNQQIPRGAEYEARGFLLLHSAFPTIQGEGPFCGERALFFRLADCNLRCPGCDTEYTSARKNISPAYLVDYARSLMPVEGALVVITGGEPMRQNIAPAVLALLDAGYRVQIETNGVLMAPDFPALHPRCFIVVSPKTSSIHAEILQHADAFKYVLRAEDVDSADGLPTKALGHSATPRVARPRPGARVYVQPMDERDPVANALNLDACIRSTMAHGYTLQIQVHKIINME